MSALETETIPPASHPGAVEPRNPRGMRDLDPGMMLERERVLDIIRGLYQTYGFVPLQTPAGEHLDVLFGSAGEESQKQIFRVSAPDADHLALRFDLTVPLARFYAQYPQLPRPFRRYQCSPVWRADKPEKGRYREFTQLDIDSIGVPGELADAEIIACICDTPKKLRLRYQVKFSSRALLDLLLHYAGIPVEDGIGVFRVLDKLDKVGIDRVRDELTRSPEQGGLGLFKTQIERIELFLAIKGTRKGVVQQVRELFRQVRGATDEIAVLRNISDHLDAMGYHDDRVIIDLSIARGLAYYKGPVVEAMAIDAPELGAILGGGRYDDLVERFGGGRVPATGASIGVDRLLDVMERLGLTRNQDQAASAGHEHRSVADERMPGHDTAAAEAGIPELYLGSERGVKQQLKHAEICAIPIALLYGTNEHAKNTVTLKNLMEGGKNADELQSRVEYLLARKGQREYARTGARGGRAAHAERDGGTIMNECVAHARSSLTTATFVVLATGYLGRRIARLAAEHAQLDADRRRVLCDGDAGFPDAMRINIWRNGAPVAAVVLDRRGEVCDRLDVVRATSEAWIEDAFLRANRESG